jgi:hypothetical protein
MDKYFNGLPFDKVTLYGRECYKGPDGCFYRVDEGDNLVALECAGNEHDVEINDFEDIDLFAKKSKDSDMSDAIRTLLMEVAS